MLNLREYRPRFDHLADHLPWAALVAPGVVLNKDGSFQRTIRFRGPDLESATESELVASCAQANNILQRLGSGWALFFSAERLPAHGYPKSNFPDPLSALVDRERRADFEMLGARFDSHYHLTLLWLPSPDRGDAAARFMMQRTSDSEGRDWRHVLRLFINETNKICELLQLVMHDASALDDDETLTLLHRCISTSGQRLRAPETPMYLDALLADVPFVGGLEPMLGRRHLRILTIKGFPALSRPGILNALNELPFEYRWMTRFVPLDRDRATHLLNRYRRQWFNKRKSVSALLREVMYNQPSPLLDSNADNQVVDSDLALQALGEDDIAFGYLTTTISVSDESRSKAEEYVRAVERVVHGLGFTCTCETLNAAEAWLSNLPGHAYANVRQYPIHTLNLAHLMPLSAVWSGPEQDDHLSAPPLLHARTGGSTPFRFAQHVGDVGHLLIVGPTGAGKSVLLATLALQFRRYKQARVIIFDKGLSARAVTLGMSGIHHPLGVGGDAALSFQPLRHIDNDNERKWAAEWIGSLLTQEGAELSPRVKQDIWDAMSSLATAPPDQRTLSGLSMLLPSRDMALALSPFTTSGPFGSLLDADCDKLALADVLCFETENLMALPSAIGPVLTYLFHWLEKAFDGRPTLLILDEAWLFLDNPLFAARIREWLKVLRKRNVSVVFATQSLADIEASPIAPAIIESCPQRILLPNDRASNPQSRGFYERFGLNTRQIELVARAAPKRDYYLQSARGNRLFELGLGPIALAFCATSDAAIQRRIDAVLDQDQAGSFAATWLRGCGLDWASDLIDAVRQDNGAGISDREVSP